MFLSLMRRRLGLGFGREAEERFFGSRSSSRVRGGPCSGYSFSSIRSPGGGGNEADQNLKIGGKGGGKMWSWEVSSYAEARDPPDLQLSATARIPVLKGPNEVLVRVLATSLNPIDLAMSRGYGAGVLNGLRALDDDIWSNNNNACSSPLSPRRRSTFIEFPLTLGRDFAGIVEEMGHGVKVKGLRPGDEVYGVLGVQRRGAQAEFVLASADTVQTDPVL
jgi:hypothetical protein